MNNKVDPSGLVEIPTHRDIRAGKQEHEIHRKSCEDFA